MDISSLYNINSNAVAAAAAKASTRVLRRSSRVHSEIWVRQMPC